MTSVSSSQSYVSLCPISFCNPRTNLPVIPGISWLPCFAFQFLMMKRIIFPSLVLVLEGVGPHRPVNVSFFGMCGCGIDWIAVMLNALPILSFFTLHANCRLLLTLPLHSF